MRMFRILPAALAALALAACGDQPPADDAASQAAAETAAALAATSCWIAEGTLEEAQARPSPLSETAFSVGALQGTICYGAPSVKGRTIMGELVPFGEPWRLGANEATALHLSEMAMVGGVHVEAGSYSLYAVPTATEWTFYLNSNVQRWGIPIDDGVRATDVGSFTVTPEATEAPVETLTFTFEPVADGSVGALVMEWESTRVRIPIAPMGTPMDD